MGVVIDDLAPSAVIVSSIIHEGVTVGKRSFVFDCTLESGAKVGSECILMGIHWQNKIHEEDDEHKMNDSKYLNLPDRHCMWEVPLRATEDRVILCCGIGDNPKAHIEQGGTFCGKPWSEFFTFHDIKKQEIWPQTTSLPENLWFAKLFPISPAGKGSDLAMWMMGFDSRNDERLLKKWRQSVRISLADLHSCIDFGTLYHNSARHRAGLAAGFAEDSLKSGSMGRNLAKLFQDILHEDIPEAQSLKSFLKMWSGYKVDAPRVPASRVFQVYGDLYRACGDHLLAVANEQKAWQAVATETAAAIGQQFSESEVKWFDFQHTSNLALEIFSRTAVVRLPVRVDIVGGWSDTPPWSLECIGRVLNMAVLLEGSAPIGAEVHVTSTLGVTVSDDLGNSCFVEDPRALVGPFLEEDPFRLVKAALAVTGYNQFSGQSAWGLEIRTWANTPRGSGLGSSSILAAAVVKALLQVKDSDSSDSNVVRLVLVLEQLMGTGGGWQDQVGGIYNGIKCTTSFPGPPLTLEVQPIHIQPQLQRELEQRMLLVFTGQVRLARTVLQRVVQRYLQRDAVLITTVRRLAELAKSCHEVLIAGNLDHIGKVMLEAWHLHQELDPHCSNSFVDQLFQKVSQFSSGFKLVGAGGGGFALVLAKDVKSADHIKDILIMFGEAIQVYNWSLCLS
ncbi:hypothetical protein O6H91_03G028100 [Diphasiastrum complanatum]|nr:hypothetical protein O6H91_03G028100 [Diphasiastrum complanatum]